VERAASAALDGSLTPNIDFVSPNGDLGIIDQKFDIAFSSHCIEHQADLIRHLQHVARILHPDGRYFLIIPDKRYCFDHFLHESSLSDVVSAFVEERRTPSFKSVFEHRLMMTQ
jgi:SAM-dependent methyltransferase